MDAAFTSPAPLAPSELEQLDREGYLHLRAALGPAELAAVHRVWERRLAEAGEGGFHNWGPTGLKREPELRPLLEHPRVCAALARLLGGDLRLRSLAGRAPPQGHGRQGLHVDWSAPAEPHRQLLANAFWALDDMAADNGATRLVPGSHRWARLPRGEQAQPLGRHPAERVLALRAGDVVVASSHVWHSGTLNSSGRRRRLVIAQWCRPELAGAPTYEETP